MASYFAVYRNIDALYDVLLRVSETATLAGSQTDGSNLQGALSSLEGARRDLGDAISQLAVTHEQELANLRSAAEAAAAAAVAKPAAPTKTVVDDGPTASAKSAPSAKKKKKLASEPPPNAAPAPQ
ncbi:hypothetical protein ACPOL_4288 [Acidisarcina polymorpha]|uniref:Uncharacterized protein n=2 Tax=Acidisarcina polymorpha TaxID=2211140 RepID=A0A2Z5G2X4_9BACT|nr:hypothetical protein ACPOL_4288 [Acidisarcina polymorpha]